MDPTEARAHLPTAPSLDVSASRAAASLDVSASRAAASLDVSASRAAASLDLSAARRRAGTPRARHSGPPRIGLVLAFAWVACSEQPPAPGQVSEAQLRAELTPLVRDQLRAELRSEVAEELRREMSNAAQPSRPVDPTRATHNNPKPNTATPDAAGQPNQANPTANEDPQGDIWNRPGTTIWPSPGGLRLVELSVGTALEEKLPVGIASHYPNVPEILFCYTVFENPGPDQTVTHVWRRSGRLVSKVELEVGKSPKWRTWSKQRTAPHWRGVWSCEVLSPDGTQLGLHVFQVGG